MRAAKNVTAATTELTISYDQDGNKFACSSSEVLNSVINDISGTIDEEHGLKITIEYFGDQNGLEAWPISQLVTKCSLAESIKLYQLHWTTAWNRRQLLDFVG